MPTKNPPMKRAKGPKFVEPGGRVTKKPSVAVRKGTDTMSKAESVESTGAKFAKARKKGY